MSADRGSFRVDDFDAHTVAKFHIARQRNQFIGAEAAKYFVARGVGDSHLNFAFLQKVLSDSHAKPIIFDHKYKAFAAFGGNCAAGNDQHAAPLLRIDAHTYIYVRQEFQLVVIHRAEQLANASGAALNHLLRDYFRTSLPGTTGQSVPGDLNRLIRLKRPDFRLIHKRTHPHFVKISHCHQSPCRTGSE